MKAIEIFVPLNLAEDVTACNYLVGKGCSKAVSRLLHQDQRGRGLFGRSFHHHVPPGP